MIHSGHVAFHDDLAPLLMPIDSAQPHPENYNEGDLEAIDASFDANGMYKPVLVQRSTGYIISGNHTWLTCKERQSEVCPMVWLDVDDDSARRIMVDDNGTARLARPNPVALLNLLKDLREKDAMPVSYSPLDVEVLEKLAEIRVEHDEFGTWPTLTFKVPPHLRAAFMHMTREADTDKDRFELLLRLAGWDGN